MSTVALVVALLACVLIVLIGVRFVVAPRPALAGYGVAEDRGRAMTAAKGVRDIASGVIVLVVWLAAGRHAMGWALTAAALIALGDAVVVVRNGGTLRHALSVHVGTAVVLVAAGLVLALV
jgi:hypothetical protein